MSDGPIILAIDTTSQYGSLVVRRGLETVAELHLQSADGFGHLILQATEAVLAKAKTNLEEVDCFAAASGPGSFTGVRVGLSTIKGLAEALHKPAEAISNLRALSLAGHAPLRAVALDARRGQVYGAVYDARAKIVVEEMVATWDEWFKTVPVGAEFMGLEDGPCQAAGLAFTVGPRWLAPAIAECAARDGGPAWTDPVAIDANYVRRSDAELFWKDG